MPKRRRYNKRRKSKGGGLARAGLCWDKKKRMWVPCRGKAPERQQPRKGSKKSVPLVFFPILFRRRKRGLGKAAGRQTVKYRGTRYHRRIPYRQSPFGRRVTFRGLGGGYHLNPQFMHNPLR